MTGTRRSSGLGTLQKEAEKAEAKKAEAKKAEAEKAEAKKAEAKKAEEAEAKKAEKAEAKKAEAKKAEAKKAEKAEEAEAKKAEKAEEAEAKKAEAEKAEAKKAEAEKAEAKKAEAKKAEAKKAEKAEEAEANKAEAEKAEEAEAKKAEKVQDINELPVVPLPVNKVDYGISQLRTAQNLLGQQGVEEHVTQTMNLTMLLNYGMRPEAATEFVNSTASALIKINESKTDVYNAKAQSEKAEREKIQAQVEAERSVSATGMPSPISTSNKRKLIASPRGGKRYAGKASGSGKALSKEMPKIPEDFWIYNIHAGKSSETGKGRDTLFVSCTDPEDLNNEVSLPLKYIYELYKLNKRTDEEVEGLLPLEFIFYQSAENHQTGK